MIKRDFVVMTRDTVIFVLGALIIARQGGVIFTPPSQVSIPLLAAGMIMCNVPGILHVIAWRSGVPTGLPSSPAASSPQGPQQGPSFVPSSDGET